MVAAAQVVGTAGDKMVRISSADRAQRRRLGRRALLHRAVHTHAPAMRKSPLRRMPIPSSATHTLVVSNSRLVVVSWEEGRPVSVTRDPKERRRLPGFSRDKRSIHAPGSDHGAKLEYVGLSSSRNPSL